MNKKRKQKTTHDTFNGFREFSEIIVTIATIKVLKETALTFCYLVRVYTLLHVLINLSVQTVRKFRIGNLEAKSELFWIEIRSSYFDYYKK